jgi:LacI family transcriptional regulator
MTGEDGERVALSMKELAELAGLDPSTVSRALRGDSRRVAKSTIERVRRLALETGYTPDPAAAALRGGASRLLGVVVNTLDDIVMGILLTAIVQESHRLGYQPMVMVTREDPETRADAIRRLQGRRVDGIILCDSVIGHEVPEALVDSDIPLVFAMRGCDGQLSVVADDLAGGALVAEHFLAQGHTEVGLVPGPAQARTATDRAAGFRAVIEHHPSATLAMPGIGGYEPEQGYQATRELFTMKQQPTAIFCTNDPAAIGATRALIDLGFRVGSEVAVAGYNDLPSSRYLQTPLTSVSTDIPAMGREAAARVVNWIQGGAPSSYLLAPELRIRESSTG